VYVLRVTCLLRRIASVHEVPGMVEEIGNAIYKVADFKTQVDFMWGLFNGHDPPPIQSGGESILSQSGEPVTNSELCQLAARDFAYPNGTFNPRGYDRG
jgi:hypothetical protein